jgi:hypothetical protein
MALTCDFCGTSVEDDVPPLTWSVSVEVSGTKRYCERCTREHVRAMEGKLDADFW